MEFAGGVVCIGAIILIAVVVASSLISWIIRRIKRPKLKDILAEVEKSENIGSAYFCKPEEAGTYQSIHLSLTGARALAAPLFGVVFYEMFGFTLTFSLSIASLLVAIGLMLWSYRNE